MKKTPLASLIVIALVKRMTGVKLTPREQRVLAYSVDAGTHGQNVVDGPYKIRVGE